PESTEAPVLWKNRMRGAMHERSVPRGLRDDSDGWRGARAGPGSCSGETETRAATVRACAAIAQRPGRFDRNVASSRYLSDRGHFAWAQEGRNRSSERLVEASDEQAALERRS